MTVFKQKHMAEANALYPTLRGWLPHISSDQASDGCASYLLARHLHASKIRSEIAAIRAVRSDIYTEAFNASKGSRNQRILAYLVAASGLALLGLGIITFLGV